MFIPRTHSLENGQEIFFEWHSCIAFIVWHRRSRLCSKANTNCHVAWQRSQISLSFLFFFLFFIVSFFFFLTPFLSSRLFTHRHTYFVSHVSFVFFFFVSSSFPFFSRENLFEVTFFFICASLFHQIIRYVVFSVFCFYFHNFFVSHSNPQTNHAMP